MELLPPRAGLRLDRRSRNIGPHFVVFLLTCSKTAIFLIVFGIESVKWLPSHGLYRRAVITPKSARSCGVVASSKASTKMPVEPKMNSAASAFSGPEYSMARYFRPVRIWIVDHISAANLNTSAAVTARVVGTSIEVALEDAIALSTLLSLLEEPTEESVLLAFEDISPTGN